MRMPVTRPGVPFAAIDPVAGLWSTPGLRGRFLEAVVALQSSGVRVTAGPLLQEMQLRRVTGGVGEQVASHLRDYCSVLVACGGRAAATPGPDAAVVQ
jgi:hypothetical protein